MLPMKYGKLAEQSANAAKEISGLITEIKTESEKAVAAMAEGDRQVQEGSSVVKEVGGSIKSIIDFILPKWRKT